MSPHGQEIADEREAFLVHCRAFAAGILKMWKGIRRLRSRPPTAFYSGQEVEPRHHPMEVVNAIILLHNQ